MSKFREYVTSSAFRLDLSRNMINWILAIDRGAGASSWVPCFIAARQACERRGLCEVGDGPPILTEEGELVVRLLKLAGFCLQVKEEAG